MKRNRLLPVIFALIATGSACSSSSTVGEGGNGEEVPPAADAATDQVPPSSDLADVDAALKDGMKPADKPADPGANLEPDRTPDGHCRLTLSGNYAPPLGQPGVRLDNSPCTGPPGPPPAAC